MPSPLSWIRTAWTRPPSVDRDRLVGLLPPVEYHRETDERQLFDEAALPAALPLMLKLDQEAEYLLCRAVAERALGSVPEPEALPE